MSTDGHPLPAPGWYPDPWGHAAYRWWSGTAWEAPVTGPARPSKPGWPVQSVALGVSAITLLAWVGLWVAIFLPLILLNDADNGRFGHDIRTLWIPEVGPAAITTIVLLVAAGTARQRPLGRATLAVCALLTAATVAGAATAMVLHHA